jgi:hypothetical protein
MFTVGVRDDPNSSSRHIMRQMLSKWIPMGASGAIVAPDTLGQTSMGEESLAASELTPSQRND